MFLLQSLTSISASPPRRYYERRHYNAPALFNEMDGCGQKNSSPTSNSLSSKIEIRWRGMMSENPCECQQGKKNWGETFAACGETEQNLLDFWLEEHSLSTPFTILAVPLTTLRKASIWGCTLLVNRQSIRRLRARKAEEGVKMARPD